MKLKGILSIFTAVFLLFQCFSCSIGKNRKMVRTESIAINKSEKAKNERYFTECPVEELFIGEHDFSLLLSFKKCMLKEEIIEILEIEEEGLYRHILTEGEMIKKPQKTFLLSMYRDMDLFWTHDYTNHADNIFTDSIIFRTWHYDDALAELEVHARGLFVSENMLDGMVKMYGLPSVVSGTNYKGTYYRYVWDNIPQFIIDKFGVHRIVIEVDKWGSDIQYYFYEF
jgi:hypothetical protein